VWLHQPHLRAFPVWPSTRQLLTRYQRFFQYSLQRRSRVRSQAQFDKLVL
jgi:hypothetical protein